MSLPNDLRNEHLCEDEAAELQASVDAMSQQTGAEREKAVGIAALFLEKNQNAKAFEVLQHFLDSKNDLISVSYYLGEVYENADQFDQAKENYKIAARLASEVLFAASAGLARVETDPNQKQTRLKSAKSAFETLQALTNDDFVPAWCEEQKGNTIDMLGQLMPGADNANEKKQLLLKPPIKIQCGDPSCGPIPPTQVRGLAGCRLCAP